MHFLAVGCGGFLGAIARYAISGYLHHHYEGKFPVGTFVVNFLGCLIIGFMATLVETRDMFSPNTRLLIITGFLGSLTTFSTFGYETWALLKTGNYKMAGFYVSANMVLGLAGIFLSVLLARWFGRLL